MDGGTTSGQVITAIRQSFCCTVIPETVWSDGGPQFKSKKFNDFARQWGFTHKLSSHITHKATGKQKPMKKLISTSWNGRQIDHDHLCQALLQYRNTPSCKDSLSPAQKLYGHPVQDTLPAHRCSFAPEWQHKFQEADVQREHYLQTAGNITTLTPTYSQISMSDLVWLSSIHKQGSGRHTGPSLQ